MATQERRSNAFRFFYQTVDTDTWQKIVCCAKYMELYVGEGDVSQYRPGDILIFCDKSNPYPRAVTKIDFVKKYDGFKEAWAEASTHALGYIGKEDQVAHYTDYEYEYPMRKILEFGVISVRFTLLSAEYVKRDGKIEPRIPSVVRKRKTDEKVVTGGSETAVPETAVPETRQEKPAVEEPAEQAEERTVTEGWNPVVQAESVSVDAGVTDTDATDTDVTGPTAEPDQPTIISSGESTPTAMEAAFRNAMASAAKHDSDTDDGEQEQAGA